MLAAALLAAGGCSPPATAIVVEVWSDLDTPEQIDAVQIALDTTPVTSTFTLDADQANGYPRVVRQVSLVPRGGTAQTRVIEAVGLKDGHRVVAQAARLSFASGQRRVLTLYLGSDCLGQTMCPPGSTCHGGSCVSDVASPDRVRTLGAPGPDPASFKRGATADAAVSDGPRLPPAADGPPPPPADGQAPGGEAGGPGGADTGTPGGATDGGPTCNPGEKSCAGRCIPADNCCEARDCPLVTGGTVTCSADHTCEVVCPNGTHLCAGMGCVSDLDPATCGTSCTRCPQPTGGTATCNGTQCGASCLNGKEICGSACIDRGAPCMGTCPGGQHICNNLCVPSDSVNSCGTRCAPCAAAPANGNATCIAGVCDFACQSGYKRCTNRCIRNSTCCVAADCPAVPNGARTCTSGVCGATCNSGFMMCGSECRPRVAEDCFNDSDDDCDGNADCADADCTGAAAVCMPSAGVTPGTQVPQNTSCPADFSAMTNLFAGLVRATSNDCTGCDCNNTGRMNCSLSISRYPSPTACMAGTGDTNPNVITLLSPCWTTSNAGGWHFSALSPLRSCVAANGTPSIPAPRWSTTSRFCAAGPRGGGCGAGRACVPRPAGTPLCVLAPSGTTCPAGYTGMMSTWYSGFTGSQSCSCTCGQAFGGSCATVSLHQYGGTSVGCDVQGIVETTFPSNNCGVPRNEFKLMGNPPAPTCALTKTINGTLTEQGAMTLCCM